MISNIYKLNYSYSLPGDKIANDKKIKDSTTRTTPSDQKKSGPHIVPNHPSGNLVISIGTKVDKFSSNKKPHSDSESEVKPFTKYQKTKNAMNIPKAEDDRTPKTTEKPSSPQVESNTTIINLSLYNSF